MILTGKKLEEFGKKIWGRDWVQPLSKRLDTSRHTIMRARDADEALPRDWQRVLIDCIDEQFAELGDIRSQLHATFDDI